MISDDELSTIVKESNIPLVTRNDDPEINIKLSFRDTYPGESGAMPITHLAAATVFMWEVSARVASVVSTLTDTATTLAAPPMISAVTSGTVNFALGGALLATGLAFMVAASGHYIPVDAEQLAYWGGAFISSVSVVEMAINWAKTLAELKNLGHQNQLADSQIDLNKTQADLNRQVLARQGVSQVVPPPARLILLPDIKAEAQRAGISEGLGVQLLNKGLASTIDLKRAAGSPTIAVSRASRATRARSTSAH